LTWSLGVQGDTFLEPQIYSGVKRFGIDMVMYFFRSL
jgi:hypothetical protein